MAVSLTKKKGKHLIEKDGVYLSMTDEQLEELKQLLREQGPVAQPGERLPYKQEVVGSTPTGTTNLVNPLPREVYSDGVRARPDYSTFSDGLMELYCQGELCSVTYPRVKAIAVREKKIPGKKLIYIAFEQEDS